MRAIFRLLANRPVRFLLAAGINTGFGYAVFFVALLAGLLPGVALVVSTVLGIAFNFVSTGTIAFGSRDPHRLPAFCAIYAVLFVINLVALRVLVAAGTAPALAQALLLLPLSALSYVAQRDFVFKAGTAGAGMR